MKQLKFPGWKLAIIPVVVAMMVASYLVRHFVADELIAANQQVATLQQDLEATLENLEREQARRVVAERDADVMRRANELLRESERDRQDEIASLQADLAFYRRLGGASGSQAPLAVHYLELQTTQSPRVYRMIFTLTQNLRWAAVISGQVQLGLDGILNGTATHLTQEQLLAESARPLTFKFKYFQQLERLITLPEGFEADRLTVRLRSGVLREPVEKSMAWQSLFNRSSTGQPASHTLEAVGED
jgi:hypothetical protein